VIGACARSTGGQDRTIARTLPPAAIVEIRSLASSARSRYRQDDDPLQAE
jgi:hypothetical protein